VSRLKRAKRQHRSGEMIPKLVYKDTQTLVFLGGLATHGRSVRRPGVVAREDRRVKGESVSVWVVLFRLA